MNTTTETKRPTDWCGWKITDEQAAAIRNGDADARNRFYLDNLDRIRAMACNYSHTNPRCRGMLDDMAQTVYADLSLFRQENGAPVTDGVTLSGFIYSSFRFAPLGGMFYLAENNPKMLAGGGVATYAPPVDMLSLDRPFGKGGGRHQDDGNERTLAETVAAPDTDIPLYTDYTDDCKTIVADFLSPREREYFDLFIEGYGNSVISERMGYKGESNNGARVRDKLRENYAPILDALAYMGVNVDAYKGKTPYNPKAERTYKLTPAQRAAHAESMRRQRAAKKAAALAAMQQPATQAAATL